MQQLGPKSQEAKRDENKKKRSQTVALFLNLVCEEFHAEGAVDDVAGRALEARVGDAHEGGAEGVVVLELHHQAHVVELLVFGQPLHVLLKNHI